MRCQHNKVLEKYQNPILKKTQDHSVKHKIFHKIAPKNNTPLFLFIKMKLE